MGVLVELKVEKMFRCKKTDEQLIEGKYYFKVKDPQLKTSYVETFYIIGNTIDNHRETIHGFFNPVRKLYVQDVCELLETLYEINKTRTFRYLGIKTTFGSNPRTYHKLLDIGCGYEYRHYGDLPIADWAIDEEKVLDVKLIDDSEELELSLHQELTDDSSQNTSVTSSDQESEPDWLSPTKLFEMIEEEGNYDRLFMNVYRHAQNRFVVIPRFLKAIKEKRSSWVFEYINYLLETFSPSFNGDAQLTRDIARIVIKIERYICETEGLMEALGVTDKQMCAQKARLSIQNAVVLKTMADMIENQSILIGMIEKMNKSLMSYGTLIEESDIEVAAVLNTTLNNFGSLLQQNGEAIIAFLNGLSYHHIIKDNQKSKIRVALKNKLLTIPDNLPDSVVVLSSLMLLADSENNLDEDDRKSMECLLLLAIAKACDPEQKDCAFTALVNALSSQNAPDGLISWSAFDVLQRGLRDNCLRNSLQQIMEKWPANPNASSALIDLVNPGFKNKPSGTRNCCWNLCNTAGIRLIPRMMSSVDSCCNWFIFTRYAGMLIA